jgi:hypothetical protein
VKQAGVEKSLLRKWIPALLPAAALLLISASAFPQAGSPKAAPTGSTLEPTPRRADGRVNLGSTPEHKGYWEVRPIGGKSTFPRPADVPLQPWARALADHRRSVDIYPPQVNCKASGGPSFFTSPGFEIVDVPEERKIFILNIAGPHSWRVIYMDGRPHPEGKDLRPTYLGHSIGRWDGDALVIDTVGFNEKQWISGTYPNTEKLHLVERISRANLETLVYQVTFEDPGAFTAAWSGGWTIDETTESSWIEGGEMFEYICQDSRE